MMKCPKLGDRVLYKGGPMVGRCVGIVTAIYPSTEWDENKSDAWNALYGKPLPESLWRVAMKPDELPKKWSYPDNDKFAPKVADLKPAKA